MKIGYAIADAKFDGLINAIGIDPGRNWGCGILWDGVLYSYWGTFPKCDEAIGYHYTAERFITEWLPVDIPIKVAIVEGASYNDKYGQVMLEDVRTGFHRGLTELGFDISFVAPQSARKQVFGNGRTKAGDVWLQLNHNGADGSALALYGGGYGKTCT